MFELIDMLIVRPITNILFIVYGFVGDFGLAIIYYSYQNLPLAYLEASASPDPPNAQNSAGAR
jgi:hypothetical protein